VGLGYVEAPPDQMPGEIGADEFEIEIAGTRYAATASLRPMFDPTNSRIKS
jgi:4-methylaminobutanoate oxidase (formaldehyde-forming)